MDRIWTRTRMADLPVSGAWFPVGGGQVLLRWAQPLVNTLAQFKFHAFFINTKMEATTRLGPSITQRQGHALFYGHTGQEREQQPRKKK